MDNGVNFGGAAVPLPKLERVQSAEEAQRALAGSAIPRRAAFAGAGEPDGTDCHITPFCSPMPERAKSGAAEVKALRFAAMLKELRNAKTTRGKYEDCVNGCIDSWLSCTGDSCGKTYDKCINACDKVVDTSK